MKLKQLAPQLSNAVGPLFPMRTHPQQLEIATPFQYPDGQSIVLYCRPEPPGITATDQGTTLNWLAARNGSDRRTAREIRVLREICQLRRLTRSHGALLVSTPPEPDELAAALCRLAQGVIELTAALCLARSRQQPRPDRANQHQETNR